MHMTPPSTGGRTRLEDQEKKGALEVITRSSGTWRNLRELRRLTQGTMNGAAWEVYGVPLHRRRCSETATGAPRVEGRPLTRNGNHKTDGWRHSARGCRARILPFADLVTLKIRERLKDMKHPLAARVNKPVGMFWSGPFAIKSPSLRSTKENEEGCMGKRPE
jgi:hypothetical protein